MSEARPRHRANYSCVNVGRFNRSQLDSSFQERFYAFFSQSRWIWAMVDKALGARHVEMPISAPDAILGRKGIYVFTEAPAEIV